jgi:hypothetical protein
MSSKQPTTHPRSLAHVTPSQVLIACLWRIDARAAELYRSHVEQATRSWFHATIEGPPDEDHNSPALMLALARAMRTNQQHVLVVSPTKHEAWGTVQRLSVFADSCKAFNSNSIADNHVELINGSWFYIDHHQVAINRRFRTLDLAVFLDADRIPEQDLEEMYQTAGAPACLIVARSRQEN